MSKIKNYLEENGLLDDLDNWPEPEFDDCNDKGNNTDSRRINSMTDSRSLLEEMPF